VTKKEIVKQIADRCKLTQLQTKDIVQQTFDAIVETLLEVGRIELRNFGVFEVKQRKARKARNPRTGDKVDVPPKNVVTFKPGKDMEERVRQMTNVPTLEEDEDDKEPVHEEVAAEAGNGLDGHGDPTRKARARAPRSRKTS
jgi:nucleoid DNA-binding protein